MRKAIVLAAGKGTRMKSAKHKVLHEIGGLPMIQWILNELKALNVSDTTVVLSPNTDDVQQAVAGQVKTAIQAEALGTGHAVLCAEEGIGEFDGSCLILYGDTPLVKHETQRKMFEAVEAGADVVLLAFEPQDAARYGRLVLDGDGNLIKVVEYKDTTEEQKAIRLCNAGPMCFNAKHLYSLVKEIKNDNVGGEYYLTETIDIALRKGLRISLIMATEDEVAGVNSRQEQAFVEGIFQRHKREEIMEKGVTLIDPETVYFSYDTEIENDVVVPPCVVFGPNVQVKKGAKLESFHKYENGVFD